MDPNKVSVSVCLYFLHAATGLNWVKSFLGQISMLSCFVQIQLDNCFVKRNNKFGVEIGSQYVYNK